MTRIFAKSLNQWLRYCSQNAPRLGRDVVLASDGSQVHKQNDGGICDAITLWG